jgi:hypothetical protein
MIPSHRSFPVPPTLSKLTLESTKSLIQKLVVEGTGGVKGTSVVDGTRVVEGASVVEDDGDQRDEGSRRESKSESEDDDYAPPPVRILNWRRKSYVSRLPIEYPTE